MSLTIIHSNASDIDTKVLKYLWEGIDEANVISIGFNSKESNKKVDKAISNEKDTLIMCGHGSSQGLFNNGFGNAFLIHSMNRCLIKAKRVIGVWCHASDFARLNKLSGFFSSMFISNPMEASFNGIQDYTYKTITNEEILFCKRVNELIKKNIPMCKWIDILKESADMKNEVVKFNYDGLRLYDFSKE